MRFPDASELAHAIDPVTFPPMARIRYDPDTPELADVDAATVDAVEALVDDVSPGSTVAIGVGSRGIRDVDQLVERTVATVRAHGAEPVVVPAMGSHGGGTAAGQRAVLAELGVEPDCPIDDRMETTTVGTASVEDRSFPVDIATAAADADAILVINRIAPHTSFTGPVESGVAKMLAVGLGKGTGARRFHRYARTLGFPAVLEEVLSVLVERLPILGGVGIIENAADRTAAVRAVPAEDVLAEEAALLARARDLLPTLPFDHVDLLVVDEMGKDVSGTGMDPNVIGRPGTGEDPPDPAARIDRLYVRSLTAETDGNANGIGLADAVHRDAARAVDPVPTYTNVLTSGYPGKAALPVVFPTDEQAMSALVDSLGAVAPDELRIARIRNTKELSALSATEPLVDAMDGSECTVESWFDVSFDDGALQSASPRSARED